ncbi:MAG: hypothetical protein QM831_36400 [Kofleriaceae bacterium]
MNDVVWMSTSAIALPSSVAVSWTSCTAPPVVASSTNAWLNWLSGCMSPSRSKL